MFYFDKMSGTEKWVVFQSRTGNFISLCPLEVSEYKISIYLHLSKRILNVQQKNWQLEEFCGKSQKLIKTLNTC